MKSFPETPVEKVALMSMLGRTSARMGEKVAVRFLRGGKEETALSYRELDRDSDAMAGFFAEAGVQKGDRVILFLPKCLNWVVSHVAIQKLGAISVPLNPAFKAAELEYFIRETEPGLAVVGMEQEGMVRGISPDVSIYRVDTEKPYEPPARSGGGGGAGKFEEPGLDDPGVIIYTSGTTGLPKGAVLTQMNLSHDAQNVRAVWEITETDVFCHALPLFHAHGLCFALHTALLAGATIIMLDSFNPKVALEVLAQKKTTMFMAVPTMYAKLLETHPGKGIDYSHLRLITSGSAPLLEKDFTMIKETFCMEPVEREGMTETLMNFSNPLHGKRKPGSIGLPLPHLEARIVDPETFRDVKEGEVGELWLRSPAIAPGYWRNPEETEKAFKDGWFRTGDLGRRDEEGYYFLTDRIKNIIISGGENISPKEIEALINSHADVIESCVVGVPDEKWGEAVAAAVAVKPGSKITEDEIRSLCRDKLLDWKCPKKIILTKELPKNRMGKVMREEVKELFRNLS